jgi:hypothetical protein
MKDNDYSNQTFVADPPRRGRPPREHRTIGGEDCYQCNCCGRWKPRGQFPVKNSVACGIGGTCNACRSVYDSMIGYGVRRKAGAQRPTMDELRAEVARQLAHRKGEATRPPPLVRPRDPKEKAADAARVAKLRGQRIQRKAKAR